MTEYIKNPANAGFFHPNQLKNRNLSLSSKPESTTRPSEQDADQSRSRSDRSQQPLEVT